MMEISIPALLSLSLHLNIYIGNYLFRKADDLQLTTSKPAEKLPELLEIPTKKKKSEPDTRDLIC